MKDSVQSNFFKDCKKSFGTFRNYSKFLPVSYNTVQGWRINKLFIPLWAVKKTLPIISWEWEYVEKNIISYKGINTSLPVLNPILPIKECPELFEITTHLICDGCVNKNGIPYYVNSKPELIDYFKNILTKIFGKVNIKLYKKNGIYNIRFSKIIPDLINHFYDVNFDSCNAKLPHEIFEFSNEFMMACLRSVIDDEGQVRDSRIVISLKNKKLSNQIRKILITLSKPEYISPLNYKSDGQWVIAIKSNGIRNFGNKIKLVHAQKRKSLLYVIEKSEIRSIGKGEHVWKTKINILKILKEKNSTTKDISRKFFITQNTVNFHLKQLAKGGLVQIIKKQKYSYIWSITKSGIEFLEKNSINKTIDNDIKLTFKK